MTQIEFCINGDLPCENAEITWIIPDSACMSSPCNGCDDTCIDVVMTEDCEDKCVQVVIDCPDCAPCERIVRTICACESESDCTECEDCNEDGVCEPKCEAKCDQFGVCVDCLDNNDCPGDYECIQGGCQCPPGQTDLGNGVCRECLVDENCDECEQCLGIKCVPKICPGQVCLGDECVDCIHSGHCEANEICTENNTCECAPGFTRDPELGICLPNANCEGPEDCPDCKECVGGNCVDKVCPQGYVCYNDDCVQECNCLNPQCQQEGSECVNLGTGVCVCLPCDGNCEEVPTPGQGTGPDPDNPNNPGQPCTYNGGCPEGQECQLGVCVPCENCTEEPCIENFVINKDDGACKIEGILETSTKCSCDVLTWSSEVFSRDNNGVSFRLRLRQGNAFISGINNIPLLRQLDIDNPFPNSGEVKIHISHKGYFAESPSNSWQKDKQLNPQSFIGTDEILTYPIKINPPGNICLDTNSGEQVMVTSVEVKFTIENYEIILDNGCEYSIQNTNLIYVLKETGGNGFYEAEDFLNTSQPFLQYKTLISDLPKNPTFFWYKSGSFVETGGSLIRKAYSAKVAQNKYRDAWLDLSHGVEIQHFYRLESDCACSEKTYFKCEGLPSKLYYCNPDISNLDYTLQNCNTQIELLSTNMYTVCSANADYPQVYQLYLNGSLTDEYTPVGGSLTIAGTYSTPNPITSIQIRLKGLDCEDCYDELIPASGSLEVEVSSYNCEEDELNVSISGGSGVYTILIDGNSWDIGDPIDLASGPHTIEVSDDVTGCSAIEPFEVDCCAIFTLNSPDAEVCTQEVGSYTFSVSGGEADYVWEVYDQQGGTLLDSGISSTENITADLSAYTGVSFYVKVTDDKLCVKDDTVHVMKHNPVDVTFNNVEYCNGDATHEIEVHLITGKLPIQYDLKQGGVSQQTGELSTATDNIDVTITGNDNFDLELTDDNGCFLSKPLTLIELSCPNPIINSDPEPVCEGLPLIIEAEITSGTAPFMWTVRDHNTSNIIGSGTGSNIIVDTGLDYSSEDGTYEFDIHVEDSKGKTADLLEEYVVIDEFDPECINCAAEPGVNVSSDVGWEVEPNDPVELTHDFGMPISQAWYVNNVFTGATGPTYFPDTSVAGSYDIYVEIEYTTGCFTTSDVETLIVSEPCDCTYGINLVSGWGVDNGSTITTNTTSGEAVCTGATINATVAKSSCGGSSTVSWTLFRNGSSYDTGTGNTFNRSITVSGTYRLEVSGADDSCIVPAVSFTKTFNVCRTCQIGSDPISDATICDGQSVSKTLVVYDSWPSAPIKFITTVNGANYGTSPDKCNSTSSCDHTQLFSGLPVGTHTVNMKAYEWDEPSCVTDQSFTITVKPINDPACQDCSNNSATITVVGQTNCSGSTCRINATEGQSVNLSASATGSPGGFSYQWSNSGGNVGSGSSVSVGPFNFGQNPTYTITVTDLEGCTFSKNIVVDVARDCSGSVSTSQTENSACQGEPVTLSWDLTSLYNYQEYGVDLWRSVSGSGGPYQKIQTGLAYNDTYTFSMPGSSWHWRIEAIRGTGIGACTKSSTTRNITLDSCVDCTGVVNSISASQNPTCVGSSVNLTANIGGSSTGWTYTWYQGSGTGGTVLGTGLTLNGYTPSSLPTTVTVGYAKSGCTGGNKQITLTQAASCCNLTINPSTGAGEICPTGSIGLLANATGNTSGWSFVWRKGTSPSGEIIATTMDATYNNITGTTVTLRATKAGCTPLEQTLNFSYSSSCCDGVVTGVSASNTSVCVNDTINLSATTNGSDPSWTYEWRRGAVVIGTGLTVNNYEVTTLPQTVTLYYSSPKCPGGSGSSSINITQDSGCCSGPPNIVGDTELCSGQSTTLISNVATPGRTLTWRRGTSPSGTILATGSSLSSYTPPSLPETIRLWGTRAGCPDVYDEVTLTQAVCCPTGITITQICTSNSAGVRVNNLANEDKVQFNDGTVISGPHPSGQRTFTWTGTGFTTVKVYVFRDTCPLIEDNTTYNVTLAR